MRRLWGWRRLLRGLLVAALLGCVMPAGASDTPTHPPVYPRRVEVTSFFRPLDLTSTWLAKAGDGPTYALPTLDDSRWTVVETNRTLQSYGLVKPDFGTRTTDVVWYRTHVHLPPNSHGLGLLLRDFIGSGQVFVNGVPIGLTVSSPEGRSATNSFDVQQAIPDGLLSSGDLTIAVRDEVKRIQSGDQRFGFHRGSSLLLGDVNALHDVADLSFLRLYLSTITFMALVSLVLLMAFCLAVSLRQEPEYRYLCVYLACVFFDQGNGFWQSTHAAHFNRFSALPDQAALLLGVLSGIEFARIILRLSRFRWFVVYEWALILGFSLFAVFTVLVSGHPYSDLVLGSVLVFLALLVGPVWLGLPLFALWVWRKQRNFDALLLSVPLLIYGSYSYVYLGIGLAAVLHWAKTSGIPPPPVHLFNVGWDDITSLFFLVALLFFLIFRTIRLARDRAAMAAEFKAEFAAAENVQTLLLARASQPTPGFKVEKVYLPANQVGGDFFLVSSAEDQSLIAIVGDVSGKGLTAAMRVSLILGILRRESSRVPATILANLNEALMSQGETGFTTACCVHLTPGAEYTVANAGHISPYVGGAEVVTTPALPLGLAADQSYEVTRGRLMSGERLVLMSDGVVEARSAMGELYGFERLGALTLMAASEIAEAAKAFGQEDDITVLTIALLG